MIPANVLVFFFCLYQDSEKMKRLWDAVKAQTDYTIAVSSFKCTPLQRQMESANMLTCYLNVLLDDNGKNNNVFLFFFQCDEVTHDPVSIGLSVRRFCRE